MKIVKRKVRASRFDRSLDLDDFVPKHLGYLLDRVNRRARTELYGLAAKRGVAGRYDPLTPGYFRLICLIPVGGARVTDLARLSGMTKQGLGQFVRVLETEGYVTTRPSPDDKRVRIVERTALGDEVVVVTNDLWAGLRRRWRSQLGPERFATMEECLTELAIGWDPNAAPPE